MTLATKPGDGAVDVSAGQQMGVRSGSQSACIERPWPTALNVFVLSVVKAATYNCLLKVTRNEEI